MMRKGTKEVFERFDHVLQDKVLLSDVRYVKGNEMEIVPIGQKLSVAY